MDLVDKLPDLKYPLVAALAGASAVLSGTIGEHTMRPALIKEGDEGLKRIKDWEVARLYHLIHSCALATLIVPAMLQPNSKHVKLTGYLWLAGVLGFSGSIYALVANRKSEWTKGPAKYITPMGGIGMMCGWFSLALW